MTYVVVSHFYRVLDLPFFCFLVKTRVGIFCFDIVLVVKRKVLGGWGGGEDVPPPILRVGIFFSLTFVVVSHFSRVFIFLSFGF